MDLLNQLPCPVISTNRAGNILTANHELLRVMGGTLDEWRLKTVNYLLPPASRIFLQTHIWPMLLSQGAVQEIQLELMDATGRRIPVLVNGKKSVHNGVECYYWVFFISLERSKFEGELLKARQMAQANALALAKSERFIKAVTDGLPARIAYWDKDLICRFANKPYQQFFAKMPDSVLGSTMTELMGPTVVALNQPHIDLVFQGHSVEFERQVNLPDGEKAHYLATYLPDFDAKAAVLGFFVLVSDITQVKKSEVEQQLAASVFESISDSIIILDADGKALSVNPAYTQITGYAPEEIVGRKPRILDGARHDPAVFSAMRLALDTEGHWEGDVWDRRKNGEAFVAWHSVSLIRGTDGEAVRYVSVFSDITARWKKAEETKHLALHDALTGLPNRYMLLERLHQSIARALREKHHLAVCFVDLDGFKAINDQWGHAAGDEVLKTVGQTLQSMLRASDTAARLGGDEFVLLIENPQNTQEVAHLAQRVIQSIQLPPGLQEKGAQLGASIGIAMLNRHEDNSADQLMKHADAAMYQAKAAGKNRFTFYTPPST